MHSSKIVLTVISLPFSITRNGKTNSCRCDLNNNYRFKIDTFLNISLFYCFEYTLLYPYPYVRVNPKYSNFVPIITDGHNGDINGVETKDGSKGGHGVCGWRVLPPLEEKRSNKIIEDMIFYGFPYIIVLYGRFG